MAQAGSYKRPPSPASSSPGVSTRKRPRTAFKWLTPLGSSTLWHGICGSNRQGVTKIAAFDLDSTLVEVSEETEAMVPRMHFARHPTDYRWMKGRREKLHELADDGYTILIFLNLFLADDKSFDWPDIQRARIPLIMDELGIDGVHVFLSTRRDEYWKPSVGAWEVWVDKWNGGVLPDPEKSFFCGDAAGREFRQKKNDFDIYDRLFASNIGLPYFEPEQIFEGQHEQNEFDMRKWNPATYDHGVPLFLPTNTALIPRPMSEFEPLTPEVVLLVGAPASGKTFLYERYFKPEGYVLVTPELASTLTTRHAAIREALIPRDSTASPRSVVIEDSLPSRYGRASYIDWIRQLSLPSANGARPRVRILWFRVPYVVLKQNSVYRALYGSADGEGRQDVVEKKKFEDWQNKFEVPDEGEGVDEIKEIRFKWLGSKEGKEKWSKYLGAVYGASFLDAIEDFGGGK